MLFGRYWNGSDRLENHITNEDGTRRPRFFIPHRIRLHGSANPGKRMPKSGNGRQYVFGMAAVGIGWR